MLLIGYIPVTKLAWISDPEERRQKKWELFHKALSLILKPLKAATRTGEEMHCADGGVCRVYPILLAHIGDWPEICMAGCTHITRCPVCVALFTDRGNLGPPAEPLQQPFLRTREYHCTSETRGWSRFLAGEGFSEA
jgi:hypothetical protein